MRAFAQETPSRASSLPERRELIDAQKAALDGYRGATLNLSWSPINRIDLVSEFLWGNSVNKGQRGEARQIQLGANFRF